MIEFKKRTRAGSNMQAFISPPPSEVATIARLYVVPKERGKHLATKWFKEFVALCLQSKVNNIITLINPDDPRDQELTETFTRRLGFRRMGDGFEENPTYVLKIRK